MATMFNPRTETVIRNIVRRTETPNVMLLKNQLLKATAAFMASVFQIKKQNVAANGHS